jgi:hypothetical protein
VCMKTASNWVPVPTSLHIWPEGNLPCECWIHYGSSFCGTIFASFIACLSTGWLRKQTSAFSWRSKHLHNHEIFKKYSTPPHLHRTMWDRVRLSLREADTRLRTGAIGSTQRRHTYFRQRCKSLPCTYILIEVNSGVCRSGAQHRKRN